METLLANLERHGSRGLGRSSSFAARLLLHWRRFDESPLDFLETVSLYEFIIITGPWCARVRQAVCLADVPGGR